MKKIILNFILLFTCFTSFAQETILSFGFDNLSNVQTSGNYYNTGRVVQRDSSYTNGLSFILNTGSTTNYCLNTNDWTMGLSNNKNYNLEVSTLTYTKIHISSSQKSSITGPRDFKLQYKIGSSGPWTDVAQATIRCDTYYTSSGNLSDFELPDVCENQPNVLLRWIMISDSSVNGGIVDINGTSSIENISIIGYTQDSSAFLDVNLIKAKIVTGGLNFCTANHDVDFMYEYPIDSGKKTIFCSALWIGAKNQNNLHLAAERYHQNGRDYYPGPVMDPISYPSEVINWNKVWKINKSEIDNHIINWNTLGYVIPNSISHWPVYANPALNINHDLAPYVDTDSDGFYNPANGDYPYIRGDQAIYFIFNDSVFQHTETGGKKLGVEVHALAYAYNNNPLLTKTVFVNYLIYNRSSRVYDSLYVGLFTDIDLGDGSDDYIGCDSTLDTYFGYNGDSIDGTGLPWQYGNNPPVQAVTMLNQPMTSFAYFNNSGALEAISDPDSANEYFLLMKNYWKDGTHFCYGGLGHQIAGGNPAIPVKYVFPGYPNDSTQWNEVNAGNPPYDRRGVGITGPMTLLPGQYISFDGAYITVDSGLAKSYNFSNVDNMLDIVPLIRDYFNSNFPQDGHDLALGIENENQNNFTSRFKVYPNPASDKITLAGDFAKEIRVDVLDMSGKRILSFKCNKAKTELDISLLHQGVYILKIYNCNESSYTKFIKM